MKHPVNWTPDKVELLFLCREIMGLSFVDANDIMIREYGRLFNPDMLWKKYNSALRKGYKLPQRAIEEYMGGYND